MDPIDPRYAPPTVPTAPDAAAPEAGGDVLGWILVILPIVGALLVAFLPSSPSTVASYATIFVSLVLIGVDAIRHKQQPAGHVIRAFLLWLLFFPYYVHARAKWGGRRLLPFALLGTALFIASAAYRIVYADRTEAYVSCKAAGKLVADGFDCSVEHRKGDETVDVCWDSVLTCANGKVGTTRKCAPVHPKQTTDVRVPRAAISGLDGCDKLTKMDVNDVQLK